MQKVLFIDRDGTIIKEPYDYQIDTVDKFEFLPGVISALKTIISTLDYRLVMVTNQDGLGTDTHPEEKFWPFHELMLRTLEGEGIKFDEIHIDRSRPEDNSPYRKPGIAMITKYLKGSYDLDNSVVIGDRWSDIQLGKNIGSKSILIGKDTIDDNSYGVVPTWTVTGWNEISKILLNQARTSNVLRSTSETKIVGFLNLDGQGASDISTGLGFYDHMLDQIARHAKVDLVLKAEGDLHIDEHHTIEDSSIVLGQLFREALGKKAGIQRYGFALPMDDARAQVLIDFGGRPWLEWDVNFQREKIGEVPTEMFFHFFKSFSDHALCNLNIIGKGVNEHHLIEGIFKAFAKAIKMAKEKNVNDLSIPSTKGII
jgi:imidazoleglycerol-phosphate dehydratase/histidinol-phosphatase